jgi:hypothetical protein
MPVNAFINVVVTENTLENAMLDLSVPSLIPLMPLRANSVLYACFPQAKINQRLSRAAMQEPMSAADVLPVKTGEHLVLSVGGTSQWQDEDSARLRESLRLSYPATDYMMVWLDQLDEVPGAQQIKAVFDELFDVEVVSQNGLAQRIKMLT